MKYLFVFILSTLLFACGKDDTPPADASVENTVVVYFDDIETYRSENNEQNKINKLELDDGREYYLLLIHANEIEDGFNTLNAKIKISGTDSGNGSEVINSLPNSGFHLFRANQMTYLSSDNQDCLNALDDIDQDDCDLIISTNNGKAEGEISFDRYCAVSPNSRPVRIEFEGLEVEQD